MGVIDTAVWVYKSVIAGRWLPREKPTKPTFNPSVDDTPAQLANLKEKVAAAQRIANKTEFIPQDQNTALDQPIVPEIKRTLREGATLKTMEGFKAEDYLKNSKK